MPAAAQPRAAFVLVAVDWEEASLLDTASIVPAGQGLFDAAVLRIVPAVAADAPAQTYYVERERFDCAARNILRGDTVYYALDGTPVGTAAAPAFARHQHLLAGNDTGALLAAVCGRRVETGSVLTDIPSAIAYARHHMPPHAMHGGPDPRVPLNETR
jgi:hypothetical protein